MWGSRRQQRVARSTADAELNALSEGVFEELLPTYQLLYTACATRPSVSRRQLGGGAGYQKGILSQASSLGQNTKVRFVVPP